MSQQLAVGGFFGGDSVDFHGEVVKIKNLANGIRATQMPAEIPLADAEKMYLRTVQAAQRFTDQALQMAQQFSNLLAVGPITFQGQAVLRDLGVMNDRLLYAIIRPARASGAKMVPSAPFKRECSKVMMSIAFGFEGLQEIDDSKGIVVRAIMSDPFLPFVLSILVSVGRVAHAVANGVLGPLKAAIDAADKGMAMMISALKWGSVAGGLYLLYKTLQPKKGKAHEDI